MNADYLMQSGRNSTARSSAQHFSASQLAPDFIEGGDDDLSDAADELDDTQPPIDPAILSSVEIGTCRPRSTTFGEAVWALLQHLPPTLLDLRLDQTLSAHRASRGDNHAPGDFADSIRNAQAINSQRKALRDKNTNWSRSV